VPTIAHPHPCSGFPGGATAGIPAKSHTGSAQIRAFFDTSRPDPHSQNQAWNNRKPTKDHERAGFIRSHNENREQYDKLGYETKSEKKKDERRAIEKTLVDAGYLIIKRRRISPRFT